MRNYGSPATLTTASYTISFNPTAGGDGYYLTRATGFGQAPLRTPVDQRPQADGAIVHPFRRDARYPSLEGYLLPVVGSTLIALMDDLVAALEEIENADGTYAWTDPGAAAKSLTVRSYVAVDFADARPKTFSFGLIAADPTIT